MPPRSKRVAVLGSTGSIGRSALEVIAASDGRLQAIALSAQSRLAELVEQARRHKPRWVVASDAASAAAFDWKGLPKGCELLTGRSVLLISHRFSSVREADRIYVLRDGEVVEEGSHEALIASGGLYAEMFTLQAAAYR